MMCAVIAENPLLQWTRDILDTCFFVVQDKNILFQRVLHQTMIIQVQLSQFTVDLCLQIHQK